jgi:hypothetical protein
VFTQIPSSGKPNISAYREIVDLASSFTVFPNPSNGDFTVQFTATDETGEVGVTVQNIYGQVVYDGTLKTTSGVNEQRISLIMLPRECILSLLNREIKNSGNLFW